MVYLPGILKIAFNPGVAPYIGDSREVRTHPAAFPFKSMTLAAARLVKEFFAVVIRGATGQEV